MKFKKLATIAILSSLLATQLAIPQQGLATASDEYPYKGFTEDEKYDTGNVSGNFNSIKVEGPDRNHTDAFCFNEMKVLPGPTEPGTPGQQQFTYYKRHDLFSSVHDGDNPKEKLKRARVAAALVDSDEFMAPTAKYSLQQKVWNIDRDYDNTDPNRYPTLYPDDFQPTDMKLTDEDGEVSKNNPLKVDSRTLKSEPFKVENYRSSTLKVNTNDGSNNYQVLNHETNKPVTQFREGETYYVEFKNDSVKSRVLTVSYPYVKEAYLYTPRNEKHQDLVDLRSTQHQKSYPFILIEDTNQSTSSSSDNATSESTDNTSSADTTSSEDKTESSVDTVKESTTVASSNSDNATSESTDMTSKDSTTNTGDDKQTEKVTFAKVDPNGQFVNGAHLTLKDMTTKQEENFVSTKAVKELTIHYNHDYVLTETRAPLGYQLAKPITFRLNRYGFIEVKQNGTYQANTRLCEVLQDEVVNGQHVLDDNTEVTVNLDSHIAHTADCGHIDEDGFENEEIMTYQQLKDKMNHLQMVDEFATKGKGFGDNDYGKGNYNNGSTDSLPATGNQKNTMLTIIGTVIVIGSIAGTIFIIRKKHK